ncbi:hypothetical protein M2322_004798 [Rhodoblastus acidophilus]|uniref:hypothetical protein n=1 Tax=Rhodoblastus acidophilus TaxID=1074 RepID=UPI0022248481|nr:hypothetical protein [Rhodoblastus acidophilus]MCW2319229.1 hypothetical protein [Rhodoblastus acidophilus]
MATSTTLFPDASNTGVQPGVALKASGPLVINTAGAVISGLDISGGVFINAPNVTLVNCKVSSNSFAVVQIKQGVTGVTVQNCSIDGLSGGGQGITGGGTFVGNNIVNCADGINVSDNNTVIKDNYIHQMAGTSDSHFDSVQIDGGIKNVTVEHNSLINENGQTSALMLDNYWGPIDNVKIDNNLLVGGGYTTYLNEVAQGQPGGGKMTNVSYTNNHIGGGQFGEMDLRTELGDKPVISGNVSDGAALAQALNTSGNATAPTPPSGPTTPGTGTTTPGTPTGSDPQNGSTPTTPPTKAVVDITNASESHWSHTATINGVADAGAQLKIFDGKTAVGSVNADSTGHWTFKSGGLSDTIHKFTAQEVDGAGHVTGTSSGAAIIGSSGHNTLSSTSGNDVFVGNGHPDTFVFAANFGHDVIKDFAPTGAGHDTIQLAASEFANFASVLSHAHQAGTDVVISFGHDALTLKHTSLTSLSAQDFHFS